MGTGMRQASDYSIRRGVITSLILVMTNHFAIPLSNNPNPMLPKACVDAMMLVS